MTVIVSGATVNGAIGFIFVKNNFDETRDSSKE